MSRPAIHFQFHCRRPRRGVACIIAMLFLVLFSVLAVGFYASTTTAAQMARNDVVGSEAQLSAESGVRFARRQFIRAALTPAADPNATFTQLFTKLCAQLNGTANMAGHNPSRYTDAAGVDTIAIPGISGSASSPSYNWMSLGTGGQARVLVSRSASDLLVTTWGRSGGTDPFTRVIRVYYRGSRGSWTPPGPGLLSRSPVVMSNGAEIAGGDITVATTQANTAPLNISGGAKIDGNFGYTANSRAPVINNGARVTGQILTNIAPPTFPEVDGSIFESFVPSSSEPQGPKVITAASNIPSGAVLTNIRIKANANKTFGNAAQLNGVIYIESPNRISFGGGSRINGIIVTDNNRSTTLSQNQITIDNGVRVEGVETLNPAGFVSSERIDDLRQLKGALVLAPNYKFVLAGGAQTFTGALVASQFDISNGYRGTINGAMVNLDDSNFTMVGGGKVTFTASTGPIAGLFAQSELQLDPASYEEVVP